MIISAAFLNIGIYFLFAALLVVCLLLLVVILMQRPKQEGLGAAFGSALTDQAFGARTTDVLKKATIYLGTFFMLTVFALAILLNKKYTQQAEQNVLIGTPVVEEPVAQEQPQQTTATPLELLERAEQGTTDATTPSTEKQEAPAPAAQE